jgi:hypothetical protein
MTTYSYKIELTDYTFIALEILLKKECKKLENEYNIIAYDRESGQTKHPLGEILKAMHESAANAQLNSFYSSGRES